LDASRKKRASWRFGFWLYRRLLSLAVAILQHAQLKLADARLGARCPIRAGYPTEAMARRGKPTALPRSHVQGRMP
jgi:hypothetical protein